MTLIKYPKTNHLPWSQAISHDDKIIKTLSFFENQRVIVTEKMDGENTTMYNHYIHARSLDSNNHPSRNWVKQLWSQVSVNIPDGWRICGENLYAKHSIYYEKLPSYFMGFSIWNDKNICLSWTETLEWFNLLNIECVPILYDGIFNKKHIEMIWQQKNRLNHEGYVIRVADSFPYDDFKVKVGKFVRANHLQTGADWRTTFDCNRLAE